MTYFIIAILVCLLDQGVKYLVAANVAASEYITVIPGLLSITRVENTGMALSLLTGKTALLGVVSLVVCAALSYVLLRVKLPHREKLALALVLGGAAGNAIDRLLLGYVLDMFYVRIFTFNLADAFIDVGAVLFVVLYFIRSAREDRAKSGTMPELERLKQNREDENDGQG